MPLHPTHAYTLFSTVAHMLSCLGCGFTNSGALGTTLIVFLLVEEVEVLACLCNESNR